MWTQGNRAATVRHRGILMMLGAALMMAVSGQAWSGTLVHNGESRVTIVLEASPRDETHLAVRDLVHYFEQISDVEVPVVDAGQQVSTPMTIFIGRDHEGLAARFPGVDLELNEHEETLIVSRGNNILIAGRDGNKDAGSQRQRGTSQAIYVFIEKYLGVRWLWPGELGTDVPQQTTITLDNQFEERFTPPLQQRYLRLLNYAKGIEDYPGERNRQEVEQIAERLSNQSVDWRRRHRVDISLISAGHAFTQWWDRFHDEHPEYFALQPNGTRDAYPRPERVKLCISNPDVIEQWTRDAVAQFEKNDWQVMVSASPNDSEMQGYCVCDDCRAWDAKSGPTVRLSWAGHKDEHVALTDRFARWWNILAKQLKEELPDREAYIGAWAYGAYRTPPVEVEKLEDNIVIGYIGSPPMNDLERRQHERENWLAWSEVANQVVWRPNFFYADRGMPVLFMERAAEDFAWLTDHNMFGLDMDTTYGHWSIQGLQYYVLAKLTWDPYADIDEVLTDYMERAFGGDAAPYMRQYFEQLEQAYYRRAERMKDMNGLQRIASLPEQYPPQLLSRLQMLLDQARDAVGDGEKADVYRQRIDFNQTGLDFTKLQLEAIAAMNRLRDGRGNADAVRQQAVEATRKRDEFLDAQLEDFTINTVWGFHNWRSNDVIKTYYGPPEQ